MNFDAVALEGFYQLCLLHAAKPRRLTRKSFLKFAQRVVANMRVAS
jgi:hypothetical protein